MILFLMTLHPFERKICKRNITTIEKVINKCAIFDIVYLTDFIYNLQPQVMFGIVHHITGRKIRRSVTQNSDQFNPSVPNAPFLYPLKTSENLMAL